MLYFIVNKKSRSGRGQSVWHEVMEVLHTKNIPYRVWVTGHEGHAGELAVSICNEAQETAPVCIVVVGGDGTINEVINGIPDISKVRLGVIPTGSGNDFCRGLGIKGTPSELIEQILTATESETPSMDLGKVSWNHGTESRLFAISSGVGLDALVCKKALKSRLKDTLNWMHLGKLTYVLLTLQSLFTLQTADGRVRFGAGTSWIPKKKTICVSVMNFAKEGGGVPMAPDADAFDGRLSVCSICGIPKWRTFFLLPLLVAGKHLGHRGIEVNDAESITVHLKKPMVLHADGEYCGDVTEIEYSCIPGVLNLLKK